MKSITIHGMDDALAKAIANRAKKDGISLNREIKRLLFVAVNACGKKVTGCNDFGNFCGVWKDNDLTEFKNNTKDFGRVDEADWK